MCSIVVTVVSPILFLEYQRVRQWWAKTTCHLKRIEYGEQASNESMQRDLVMILLRADAGDIPSSQPALNVNFLIDTSSLLLRIWLLLLESIALLESSIPAVRCATVAVAAADLTSNSICLVDLALEVKKRGLLGGVGLVIWDAFNYQLSKELQQRKHDTNDASSNQSRGRRAEEHEDDLGGQYTSSVLSAVGNVRKMSHNISCLMEQPKSEHDNAESNAKGEDEVEPSITEDNKTETPDRATDVGKEVTSDEVDIEEDSERALSSTSREAGHTPSNDNKGAHISGSQVEGIVHQEKSEHDQNDNKGGLIAALIGGATLIGGVAVAAVVANNSHDHDKKRKGSSKE
jgi:hypothetical protein